MNEWIKCSDRLPKNGEEVLCTLKKYNIVKILTYYNENEFYDYASRDYDLGCNVYNINDIIAWMECPKAYKEDNYERN